MRIARYLFCLGSLCMFALSSFSGEAVRDKTVFIEGGVAKSVKYEGPEWVTKDGCLEGQGTKSLVASSCGVGEGDFRIAARLRMLNQKASMAGFLIDDGYLGFEGGQASEVFVNGRLFGGYKNLGPSSEVFEPEEWIDFEVVREGGTIRFVINGKTVHTLENYTQGFRAFGFTPWRSTMQIADFALTGAAVDRKPAKDRAYSIQTVDISMEKERQVTVDKHAEQPLGCASTVLLEDNKTILAVYLKGKDEGSIVLKKSTDGGLTWSEPLPVPANWDTAKDAPTIYRLVDPQGLKRLAVFTGKYPIRISLSEDDGATWTPLKPIGDFGGLMAMSSVVRLSSGDHMAFFHDDGRFFTESGSHGVFRVYKTVTRDGGLTWSAPEIVTSQSSLFLCEPAVVRSPDGRQLACILSEQRRKNNSYVITSDDEGATWSAPAELPGAVTGDRHVCAYAPDGRLVIAFRDMALMTPSRGDFVAWVGTYDDLVQGAEGQCRVRLLNNKLADGGGYCGLDLLPDGTFVATVPGAWIAEEQPFVMSVRFKADEVDAKMKPKS